MTYTAQIEREPRPVTIYRFDVARTEPGSQVFTYDVVRRSTMDTGASVIHNFFFSRILDSAGRRGGRSVALHA